MLQINLNNQRYTWKIKKIRRLYITYRKFKKMRIQKKKIKLKRNKINSINIILLIQNFIIKYVKNFYQNLLQLILLNKKIYEYNLLYFFYKYNREDYFQNSFSNYLYDYNRKPFWKLRKSRNVHWSVIYSKTIKKRRYINFNKFSLKFINIFFDKFIPFIVYLNSYYISWYNIQKITKLLKLYNINLKKKSIFQLPIFLNYFINWKLSKKKKIYLKKKVGRWSFLNFKKFCQPWLQKKKNFPKVVKKLFPKLNILVKDLYYDYNIGSLLILKKQLSKNIPFINNIYNNYLLKLNTFRYKP